jgi:hypothetical protein
VHEEKDCSAEMGECAEATPVELTRADLFNLNPCSPEELAEMRECVKHHQLQPIYSIPSPIPRRSQLPKDFLQEIQTYHHKKTSQLEIM